MTGARRSLSALCLAVTVSACNPAPEPQRDIVAAVEAAAGAARGEWRQPRITGCAISALSVAGDPAGLPVHAAPSRDSKVIGTLHSLVEAPPNEEPLPSDPMTGPGFTIIAVNGDWVRITDIAPMTGGFDKLTRQYREVRNFQGLGWVDQASVMVSSDYWDKAFDQPYFRGGQWQVVDADAGVNLYPWAELTGATARILACEKDWVKLRYPRIATRVSGPQSVSMLSAAERASLPLVEGWLKSAAHSASQAPCHPADPDCPARRAHEWD